MHSKRAASFAVVTAGEVDASTFRLINTNNPNAPAGEVLGEFIDASPAPFPDYSALRLDHVDASVEESGLVWSVNGAMIEETVLTGPRNLLAPAAQAPWLALSTDLTVDTNTVSLSGGGSAGGETAGVLLNVDMTGGTGALGLIVAGGAGSGVNLNGRTARLLVVDQYADCSLALLTNAVATLVPGTQVGPVTLKATDRVICPTVFDLTTTAFGAAGVFVGELYVTPASTGVAVVADTAQALRRPNAAGDRQNTSQTFRYTPPADDDYTFELRARTTNVLTTFTVQVINTRLNVQAFASI